MNKLFRRGAGLLICAALFFITETPLRSHDPITTKLTWNREVSRLVYKRCASCHRVGGTAMDLTSYEVARPWAKAIRDEILTRRMPPWGAVKGIGDFAGDPSLSQPEIEMLVGWVEGGAPEGEAADKPPQLPKFNSQAPAMPRFTRSLNVTGETILNRPATVVALRPKDLDDSSSLEAWAIRPDGAVERLIWLSDYHKAWTRTYVLQDPVALPAGTKVRLAAKTGSLIVYCR